MNPLKAGAIKLRRAGYSYSMIGQKFGLSKSTLSNWLAYIPFVPNQEVIERVGKARLKSALYKQSQKFENIAKMKLEAAEDIGKLSHRDIFMLGIGLYLGEGSKALEQVRIANSDPMIIKLAIKWLKKFCALNVKHFKITVHAYPDTDISMIIAFWSRQTKIPASQFNKVVIDNRKNKSDHKRRTLPHGTAHLYVRGGGTLSPGVKGLHRKIMGWIEATTKQI